MNFFSFDSAIYKKLNEGLFDDDIIDTNDLTHNSIISHLEDDEYILNTFNELYNKQLTYVSKKYGITGETIFDHITHQNIDGQDYLLIDSVSKRYYYHLIRKLKGCQGFIYMFTSLELIDFINDHNIIFGTSLLIKDTDEDYNLSTNTYIFENVTLPNNFIKTNFYLLSDKINNEYKIYPTIFFINSIINQTDFNNLLIQDLTGVYILKILLNNTNIDTISVTIITDFILEIINTNIKNIDITYDNKYYRHGSTLIIKDCNNLKNVSILDISRWLTLTKLKIDNCNNINKDTLILPNHRTYTTQILNNGDLLRSINFRGDIIRWFYKFKHPEYKYIYYDSKPYINMYWKKGE